MRIVATISLLLAVEGAASAQATLYVNEAIGDDATSKANNTAATRGERSAAPHGGSASRAPRSALAAVVAGEAKDMRKSLGRLVTEPATQWTMT